MKNMKNFSALLLVFCTLFFAVSCKKDKSNITINGKIVNTTQIAVRNATVQLLASGNTVKTTQTDSEGNYSFADVAQGNYSISASANGYNTYTLESANYDDNKQVDIELLGSANITGTITNSQTGTGLANARLALTMASDLKSTVDTSEANADLIVVTDEYGTYTITGCPVGTFIIVIRATNFTTRVIENVSISESTSELPASVLVQDLTTAPGELRIILTWGETPVDIDSHLTGPIVGSEERFHMYFMDKAPSNSDVNLDVDDIYSYGPETTTILAWHNGTYRYSVFNYSDQLTSGALGIYNSPAQVEVYSSAGLLATYTAPVATAESGNTWVVFEINYDGSSFTLNPINNYETYDGSSSVLKSGKKLPMNNWKF
jgi:hypothetical protein